MELKEEPVGAICVVTARGRLDGNSSGAFGEWFDRLIAAGKSRLLVDFSGVDFVTSAGLRIVLTVLKKTKAANGAFALCGVQAPVREVLDITGFAALMQIHSDRAGGIAALSQHG